MRFVQQGHEQSGFNIDGTKREKKAPQTDFVKLKDPSVDERRKQKKGDAGVINCMPKMIVPGSDYKFDPSV